MSSSSTSARWRGAYGSLVRPNRKRLARPGARPSGRTWRGEEGQVRKVLTMGGEVQVPPDFVQRRWTREAGGAWLRRRRTTWRGAGRDARRARVLPFIGAGAAVRGVHSTPAEGGGGLAREATASSPAGSAGPRWASAGLRLGRPRCGLGRAHGLGPIQGLRFLFS
jgi:hypothetical protein